MSCQPLPSPRVRISIPPAPSHVSWFLPRKLISAPDVQSLLHRFCPSIAGWYLTVRDRRHTFVFLFI